MDPLKLAEEVESTLARNVLIAKEGGMTFDDDPSGGGEGAITLESLATVHGAVAANIAQSYAARLLPDGETVAELKTRLAALEAFARETRAFARETKIDLAQIVMNAAGVLRGGK